ncbi:low molecular weight phosphotyrosine protein phosphatase [Defluviimonas sp. WL0024]|uniref:protein-tyrosine-phosphatase n=1 Tax=Albidovulum salinarum TaxID=2984153 RepID=A0ABT2X772_9RHOB|nr:low molecular weight protein-tyrosine-phosphatase [Defluviimonas sp. WL0024]MCU9849801.1 low molecular weight phosphotyrosine protein phosphatase [Defluviimonas sp. WL0024]
MHRILFVCLGNICRSPAAEAVFAARAAAAGLAVAVDSAGTGGWHVGNPPHPPMVAAALRRGYDLSGLRARQAVVGDFTAFDLILAMDGVNHAALEALRPRGNATPLALFLDGVAGSAPRDMPDPYYTGDFDTVLDLVEAGADALIARLLHRG